MEEYRLIIAGIRKPEPEPGSIILGADTDEVKEHHIEAETDEKAVEEAQKIANGYLERLVAWKWNCIASARLYKRIKIIL